MIKYLQLPFHFDAAAMLQEVEQLDAGIWQQHYQKLHYEGEWSAIPLRSTGGKADNIIIAPTDDIPYEDTIFLAHCPYIKEVLAGFKCPLKAVRLLKLDAGAIIKEHRDAELHFEKGEIRLHIPVITHEEVEFYLNKERILMKEGQCWYMNFNLPHNINNKSNINRIHLVIDAVVNDWVKDIFEDPAVITKKEIAEPANDYPPETKKQIILHLREMNTAISNKMADELEKELSQVKD